MPPKNRTRKKQRKRASKPKASSRLRPELTEAEMLARVPRDELLTTADIQHVFGDCHVQTVYKMIGRKELRPYKSRNRGRANVYKRAEVIKAIKDRCRLIARKKR